MLPLQLVVTGPTASGKTSLAIDIAEHLGCEIVCADSRQVYHDLPVGTAAPTVEEKARVPHHLTGFLPLDAAYSAATYESDAMRVLSDLFSRRDVAVVCGGSMMYVDALTHGIDHMPSISPEVRERVHQFYIQQGLEATLAWLEIIDPEMHRIVDRQNPKRVIHAIEITLQAGVAASSLRTGKPKPRPFRVLKFAISHTRECLFARINKRTDEMIAAGFIEEARKVYPYRHYNALNTVGYKELFAYFDGQMDLPTTIARIAKNTRVYAKKQLTWLARDPNIIYLQPENALDQAMTYIEAARSVAN